MEIADSLVASVTLAMASMDVKQPEAASESEPNFRKAEFLLWNNRNRCIAEIRRTPLPTSIRASASDKVECSSSTAGDLLTLSQAVVAPRNFLSPAFRWAGWDLPLQHHQDILYEIRLLRDQRIDAMATTTKFNDLLWLG